MQSTASVESELEPELRFDGDDDGHTHTLAEQLCVGVGSSGCGKVKGPSTPSSLT